MTVRYALGAQTMRERNVVLEVSPERPLPSWYWCWELIRDGSIVWGAAMLGGMATYVVLSLLAEALR
jgi:hypothetical protein